MNKVYITSCFECESHCYIDKWQRRVGCFEESNEMKEILTDKDFSIPDWCPKLLKQNEDE